MNSKLGVAIFGAGWVAKEHVRAYLNNKHCEIRTIGSRKLEDAQALAAQFNIACSCTTSFDEILADPKVNIVSITTANDSHMRLGVLAAQAGKHLVLEKPIALTWQDAQLLANAVETSGVKSVVSFVLNWNPLVRTIKKQLADNAIGSIFYAETDYFHAVGPWYNQYEWNKRKAIGGSNLLSAGCHAVDALIRLVDLPVKEVTAYSTKGAADFAQGFEYDPTSVLICRFENNAVGKVACSLECNCPYMFNILLMGEKGTIKNNAYYGERLLGTYGHPEIGQGQYGWATWPTVLPDSGDVSHHPFGGQIDELVNCILQDSESEISILRSMHTHEVCFAAELSAKTGKAVGLPICNKQ